MGKLYDEIDERNAAFIRQQRVFFVATAPLAGRLPGHPSARAIVRARLLRISNSCGYGVPRLRFEAEREQLPEWAARKGPAGLRAYVAECNRTSIDGLPGLGDPTEAG